MCAHHGQLRKRQQDLVQMHWVLHPTGALESGKPNIHPDRDAQFHALCVYREITRVIWRQTDRSRQYEAYVESVLRDHPLESAHRLHHAGRIDRDAAEKAPRIPRHHVGHVLTGSIQRCIIDFLANSIRLEWLSCSGVDSYDRCLNGAFVYPRYHLFDGLSLKLDIAETPWRGADLLGFSWMVDRRPNRLVCILLPSSKSSSRLSRFAQINSEPEDLQGVVAQVPALGFILKRHLPTFAHASFH